MVAWEFYSKQGNLKMFLLKVYLEFFKIGAFTFGGGQAMIPILQRELVTNLHWITIKDFLHFVSVAEITPGPISVNIATFIGYRIHGVLGAIISTAGVASPSFILILLVATAMKKLQTYPVYRAFMAGIKPVIIALLISTVYIIASRGFHNNILPYVFSIIAFIVLIKFKLNASLLLLTMGAVGIFLL